MSTSEEEERWDEEQEPRPRKPRTGKRRIIGIVAAVAVVVAVFVFVLPQVADYAEVWDVVKGLDPDQLALLLAVAAVNVATFGPPWMAAMPGLTYRRSMVLTQSSTALSSALPGGDAVGITASYAMLRGWGYSRHAVSVAVALTGLWNQFVNVGVPVLALAALTLGGGRNPLLTTAALIGLAAMVAVIVALWAVLRGEEEARNTGDWLGKQATRLLRPLRRGPIENLGQTLVEFRRETVGVLSRRWHWLTAATILGHLTVFLVLLACLRTLGVDSDQVSFVEALASWSLVRLLSAVPVTPGGLGLIELGLTAALVGFGGNKAGVVAAVLLYRALTYFPPLILGAILGLTWRKGRPAPT